MSDRIEDPNLSDLPESAFEPIKEGETPRIEQLEARIRAKREQANQDVGAIESPHHAADIEPLPAPDTTPDTTPDETPEAEVEEPVVEADAEVDEADAEPEEGEEVGEVSDEGEFFLGRYKTREEAERGMSEKDKTIARLFRENHQREAQQQQQGQQQPQLDTEKWHEWAEEAVASADSSDERIQGALLALQRGGAAGYDIYIAHWLEDEDSRAEALAFNNQVQREYAEMQARQIAQTPQTNGNVQVDPSQDEGTIAKNAAAAKYRDFHQYEDEMNRLATDDTVLDPDTRQWLSGLAQQGVEGKQRAWEYLYLTAAATAPRVQEAREGEKKRRRVSGDAAKIAATVSSAEGAAARTPRRTEAELAVIQKRNGIREKLGQPLIEE